eukprot:5323986-Prymnesium_polylepis.1
MAEGCGPFRRLPGARFKLLGARFKLPGARFKQPGARFKLPGASFKLPGGARAGGGAHSPQFMAATPTATGCCITAAIRAETLLEGTSDQPPTGSPHRALPHQCRRSGWRRTNKGDQTSRPRSHPCRRTALGWARSRQMPVVRASQACRSSERVRIRSPRCQRMPSTGRTAPRIRVRAELAERLCTS